MAPPTPPRPRSPTDHKAHRGGSEREQRQVRRKGRHIKEPKPEPEGKAQTNLTDGNSGLMRKNKKSEYQQGYNAQAVVDTEGSQLVSGVRVSGCGSDRRELVADVETVAESVGVPTQVLADNGYAYQQAVERLRDRDIEVLVAVGRGDRRRRHDFRPQGGAQPAKAPKAAWLLQMQEKLSQPAHRASYRLRQQTIEPVFGILKQVMGFRQFLLRGQEKVTGEWQLLTLAYNCKRLHQMQRP